MRGDAARRAALRGAAWCLAAWCLAAWTSKALAADPDALWHIVHDQCVPHELQQHTPEPCAVVDAARGYTVLKDRNGASQYLLIPTARVQGVEDPAVRAPDAPAYWQQAWEARRFVVDRIGHALAPADLSLAVNSVYGRSQNQLHIHIDCVAPEVRAALAAHAAAVGPEWAPFPVPLDGHDYRSRRVATLGTPGADPFALVAQGPFGRPVEMARMSIFVTGAPDPAGAGGFIVLATRADGILGNRGSAEELQDHGCAIAR